MKTLRLQALVVEDDIALNESIRYGLENNLSTLPVDAHYAYTMADTVLRLQELRLHLIVLDLTLPDSKGAADTYEKVKLLCNGVPVVILTGDAESHFDIDKGDTYFMKPDIRGAMGAVVLAFDELIGRRFADHG